jgi:uncharacterized protein (DUF2147 family)
MFKTLSIVIAIVGALIAAPEFARAESKIDGIWRQDDGSATVRVTICPLTKNWCATVIEERLNPGEPSVINQMVVKDMRPNGKGGWVGQYVADGQAMKASAKLLRPDMLAFKICAFAFLCETIRLNRVR